MFVTIRIRAAAHQANALVEQREQSLKAFHAELGAMHGPDTQNDSDSDSGQESFAG